MHPFPLSPPATVGPPLTGKSRSHSSLLLGLIADPLLTALAGELHSPREGAVGAGQAHVHAAEGHAAHRPVQAGALVLAAALEGLPAPVHHAAEDTRGAVPSCGDRRQRGSGSAPAAGTPVPVPLCRSPLTGADADPAVGGGAEVAEEPLVVVAGVALGAQLAQLLGAHPAAAAAVEHQGDAGGAAGAGPGSALALPAALLPTGLVLRRRRGERRRQRPSAPPTPCPA